MCTTCPNCGGHLIGDGFRTPVHCEFVDVPSDTETDANPLYCNFVQEAEAPVIKLQGKELVHRALHNMLVAEGYKSPEFPENWYLREIIKNGGIDNFVYLLEQQLRKLT